MLAALPTLFHSLSRRREGTEIREDCTGRTIYPLLLTAVGVTVGQQRYSISLLQSSIFNFNLFKVLGYILEFF